MRLLSWIIWKLCAFRQRSNIGDFQQFFHHNFRWNGNFEFLWFHLKDLVQNYQNIPYFKIQNIFFIFKNTFLGEKLSAIFCIFLKLLPKCSDYINSVDCIWKITSKYIRLYPAFIKKKVLFLMKKLEIQVIISIVILTRSSERVFNPSRYTGIIYNQGVPVSCQF